MWKIVRQRIEEVDDLQKLYFHLSLIKSNICTSVDCKDEKILHDAVKTSNMLKMENGSGQYFSDGQMKKKESSARAHEQFSAR